MQHLHDNNIVHRDLKSGNILLALGLLAKVCDFGTAHTMAKTTVMNQAGKYYWMAPRLSIMWKPISTRCMTCSPMGWSHMRSLTARFPMPISLTMQGWAWPCCRASIHQFQPLFHHSSIASSKPAGRKTQTSDRNLGPSYWPYKLGYLNDHNCYLC